MTASYRGRVAGLQRSGGGVPKLAVARAEVGHEGMSGDRQANRKHHGGPERALCVYALERLEGLVTEGHDVQPGALGENVTVEGLPWALVRPGARLTLGEVETLVTSFAAPCSQLRPVFADASFTRISEAVHPGWSRVYVRVLHAGKLSVGDPVTLSV